MTRVSIHSSPILGYAAFANFSRELWQPQQRRRPRSSSSGALSLSMAAKQRRDVRPAAPLAAPSPSFTEAADPGAARKMIFPPSPSCESVKWRVQGESRCMALSGDRAWGGAHAGPLPLSNGSGRYGGALVDITEKHGFRSNLSELHTSRSNLTDHCTFRSDLTERRTSWRRLELG
ncbi:unnamed protein product [Lampetra planeri]